GGEPEPDPFGAGGEIGRRQQRVAEQLAAPDAEVVLRKPDVIEAAVIQQRRDFAHLHDEVVIRPLLGRVLQVLKVAELHLPALRSRPLALGSVYKIDLLYTNSYGRAPAKRQSGGRR